MGAEAFGLEGTIAGMAGISLEQYAACLGTQLSGQAAGALSVQLAHRAAVHGLLQDLSDASERRFEELVAEGAHVPSACTATAPAPVAAAADGLAAELVSLAPSRRLGHAESAMLHVARELVGESASELLVETPLMEAGVDSMAATELSTRLRAVSGVALSPTLLFEHPTARAFPAHWTGRRFTRSSPT
jgi:Phosphopantetheine attachment site.